MKAKEPHFLTQDDSGHWYLVPESKAKTFEDMLNILNEAADDDYDIWERFENQFEPYRIDGPHRLKILAWEEI